MKRATAKAWASPGRVDTGKINASDWAAARGNSPERSVRSSQPRPSIMQYLGDDRGGARRLDDIDEFREWFRRYVCSVRASVLSVGAVRLVIDYVRDGHGVGLEDAYRNLLLPLWMEGLIELVSIGGYPRPRSVWDAVVNADKARWGCRT